VRVNVTTRAIDDLEIVYAELRGKPGISVEAVAAPIEPGDQGSAIELLGVALSGGAVTKFLEIIKVLLESRGPGFSLKLRRGKDVVEITAENAEEALPLVRELLGGP
jgi:hypothetical protein